MKKMIALFAFALCMGMLGWYGFHRMEATKEIGDAGWYLVKGTLFCLALIVSGITFLYLGFHINECRRRRKTSLTKLAITVPLIASLALGSECQARVVEYTIEAPATHEIEMASKPAANEPIKLLSAPSGNVSSLQKEMLLESKDGGTQKVLPLVNAKFSINSFGVPYFTSGKETFQVMDYHYEGDYVFLTLKDSLGKVYETKLIACLAVIAGIVVIVYAGYKLYQCVQRLGSNISHATNASTNDELVAYPPPSVTFSSSAFASYATVQGGSDPSGLPLLSPPEGCTLVLTNLEAGSLIGDVSSMGWTIGGLLVTQQVLMVVYPTNLVVVDANGASHPCELQWGTNLTSWSPAIGPYGTVILNRRWETLSIGNNPAYSMTVSYIGGVPCYTNVSTVTAVTQGFGIIKSDKPIWQLSGFPQPDRRKAFYRLKVEMNP